MQEFARFAVYYAPPAGSPLAAFGAAWLGWDAEAALELSHPEVPGLDVASLTAMPRMYGFHGTLKPPFRLARGTDAAALEAAVIDLSRRLRPCEAPPLALRQIGRFIALVPSAPSSELTDLAASCVRDLDAFRRAPDDAEIDRRRKPGLTVRQEDYLRRWGYPYVLDEFRFHLTLTGPLSDVDAAETLSLLEPMIQPFTASPLQVHEICLFGEDGDGRFRLIQRYPLQG